MTEYGPPRRIVLYTPFRWFWLARWMLRRRPESWMALYVIRPLQAQRQRWRGPLKRWRWDATR